jgi:hypothetical protein
MTLLSGTVKHQDGSAAAGATVEVHNARGDVVDQVRTTDEGAFTYYLNPGRWTLKTYDARGHRGNQEVAISEGDATMRVDLEIKVGGRHD